MVSMEAAFSPTPAAENASETVGGAGVTAREPGQAVALLPAEAGAALVAVLGVTVTVALSLAPAESVTVSLSISVPLPGTMVTCAAFLADVKVIPPVAVQA
jgi:hypothetical protein